MCTLSEYLAREGIRQADFSARLGVTQATISRLIRRAASPSLDLAVRIQRATGGAVPADSWVLEGAPAPAKPEATE